MPNTFAKLRDRCEALATVGDTQAADTLALFNQYNHLKDLIAKLASDAGLVAGPVSPKPIVLSATAEQREEIRRLVENQYGGKIVLDDDDDTPVEVKPEGEPSLIRLLDFHDRVVTAVNRVKAKSNRFGPEATGQEVAEAITSYQTEFGQKNLRIEWMLRMLVRLGTEAAVTIPPEGWNPAYEAKPEGIADGLDTTQRAEAAASHGAAHIRRLGGSLSARARASVEEAISREMEGGDPETEAMAATRMANGLPVTTDPAVTAVNAVGKAGDYDKTPKMNPKAEGSGL